jgi:DNA-binding NarL/FixJ family response regulator
MSEPNMPAIRMLLVDDHHLLRAGIKALLADVAAIEIVGEAGDGREAVQLTAQQRPDVILMDISLPGINGIEATRQIVAEYQDIRVIVLSMHISAEHVLQALRAGASGYIFKGASPQELELAIEAVLRGKIFLSPAVSCHVVQAYLRGTADERSALEQLTSRQREILQLVAEGNSSKKIARTLDTSVKTVDSHRYNLMQRLGVHEITGLVRYAILHGVISDESHPRS